jgi:hypothetical protein
MKQFQSRFHRPWSARRRQGLSEPGMRQWWDFLGIPRSERFELFNRISANCVVAMGLFGLFWGYMWFGLWGAPVAALLTMAAAGYFVTRQRWSR